MAAMAESATLCGMRHTVVRAAASATHRSTVPARESGHHYFRSARALRLDVRSSEPYPLEALRCRKTLLFPVRTRSESALELHILTSPLTCLRPDRESNLVRVCRRYALRD